MSTAHVYRVLLSAEWQEMLAHRQFNGSAIDKRDGYIHLSTREQVAGTIAAHFADVESELVVVEVDAASLGDNLRWERSRGGAVFPHLYDVLDARAVTRAMGADEFQRGGV
jgi:uncharacterized protein (DUF952 family)